MRELPMRAFHLALIATLAFAVSAFADTALRFQDPEKFIGDLFGTPPRITATDAAKTIAAAIGKPGAAEGLEKALKIFDGKKIESFNKVIDTDFAGALRQVIYYAYVQDVGFIYFRFNFKMTGTGWLLANFTFKSETEELFPKDFITR
jgi:hypothetical protein